MKKRNKILIGIVVILLLGISAGALYIHDAYPANDLALESIAEPDDGITVSNPEKGRLVFAPENPVAGLIFYPGGKVEYEAYAPLMEAFAGEGLLCVLLEMPGNLAVLNANAADGVASDYPQIDKWYMGGHSLGGSMAASYISEHTDDFEGLFLFASYSTKDIHDSGLDVLSIYGSEDHVLNMESYQKYKNYLPQTAREVIISGGCHAYFGSYGAQKGDGVPSISNEEQIAQTAEAIRALLSAS